MRWSHWGFLFLAVFCLKVVNAQPAWVSIYDLDTPITQIVDVENHPMGGFLAAGVGGLPGAPYEVFIIRLDSDGDIIWRKVISNDEAVGIFDVSVDDSGTIRAFLMMDLDPEYHRYTPMVSRFNEDGDLLWTEEYNDYVFNSEKPVFCWEGDGGFAAIFWDELVFPHQAFFVKGDSTGALIVQSEVNFEEDEEPYLNAIIPREGGYYLYGNFFDEKYNPYILRLDEMGSISSVLVDTVLHAGTYNTNVHPNSGDSVFYYAGSAYDIDGFTGVRLIKLKDDLEKEWEFDIPFDTLVRVNHLYIDEEGDVLLLLQNNDIYTERSIHLYKIDKHGNLQWSNTISEDHYLQSKGAYLISDGRVLVYGSYIGDPLSYKGMVTLAGQNGELPVAKITGRVFYDENGNDADDGEPGIPGVFIEVPPYGIAITGASGYYEKFIYDVGVYEVSATPIPAGFSIGYPDSTSDYSIEIDSMDEHINGIDFAIIADSTFVDLSISLFGSSILDDYPTFFELKIENKGSVAAESLTITLTIDSGYLDFDSATYLVDFASDTLLIWTIPELPAFSNIPIYAYFNLIADHTLDDFELRAEAQVDFPGADAVPENNQDSVFLEYWDLSYVGRITTYPMPDIVSHVIPISTERIEYTIEFLNPFDEIHDFLLLSFTLPNGLDISSFNMNGSGHPFDLYFDYDNKRIDWYFNSLNLTPLELGKPTGMGFVSFSFDLDEDLPPGFEFEANPILYYNYDSVWNSNSTLSILDGSQSVVTEDETVNQNIIFPNPNQGSFCIDYMWSSLRVVDLNGRTVFMLQNEDNLGCVELTNLQAGMYIVIISDENGETSKAPLVITRAF